MILVANRREKVMNDIYDRCCRPNVVPMFYTDD